MDFMWLRFKIFESEKLGIFGRFCEFSIVMNHRIERTVESVNITPQELLGGLFGPFCEISFLK